MNKRLEIRFYDYVNHPYERVRDTLKKDALTVFQAATKSAAARAHSVASELHVDFGGIGSPHRRFQKQFSTTVVKAAA